MSGIEFLEAAMDLFPHARRVLLTAYADTDAAIQAINLVDVDHYLLKPWDPPEEKLYPVLDGLIEAWRAVPGRPVVETKVIGHRWSRRSYEVRDFLARNQVPYRWYLADESEGRRLLAAAETNDERLPVVVTPDGDGAGRARRRGSSRRRSDCRRTRLRSSTTSWWWAADPPASEPRCTARPKGCARCSSNAGPPVGRRVRARGSRTTSGSPTACRERSSPTALGVRPPSSAPRC